MKEKIRFKWFKDFVYLIGVWIVMRYNPIGAGKLLERWGKALQRNYKD